MRINFWQALGIIIIVIGVVGVIFFRAQPADHHPAATQPAPMTGPE